MKHAALNLLILILVILGITMQFFVLTGQPSAPVPAEKMRQLAAKLESEELYPQAIAIYREYLAHPALNAELRANILYRIGTIYLEKTQEYENALATFIQISDLYPETKIAIEADKKKVPCYEQLKRGFDAQKKLKQLTDLHPDETGTGPIVATIGDRKIYLETVEREIAQLPEVYRTQFQTPQQKLEFLKSKLFNDLLYDMALRKDYQNNPDVRKQMQEFEKNLLATRVYTEEVRNAISVSPSDVELYYKANPQEFTTPASAQIAHIQLKTLEEAQALRQEIEQGLAFEEAAKTRSLDARTKDQGGVLGRIYASNDTLPGIGPDEKTVAALMALEAREISPPVEHQGRYHLFKILEKSAAHLPPLQEIQAQVEQRVRRMKEEEKRMELTQRLLEAEHVKIYEQALFAHTVNEATATSTP